jgi:hypothetical protein
MKRIIVPFLIAGSLLASCGSETTTTENVSDSIMTPAPDTAQSFPLPSVNDTVMGSSSVQPQIQPQMQPQVQPSASQGLPIAAQPSKSSKVMLNPAHGQPGHDCAVAVGAPLNAPAPKLTAAPSITPTASAAPANSTVRLNPAHGEPGHDCAVEVGKPLKN